MLFDSCSSTRERNFCHVFTGAEAPPPPVPPGVAFVSIRGPAPRAERESRDSPTPYTHTQHWGFFTHPLVVTSSDASRPRSLLPKSCALAYCERAEAWFTTHTEKNSSSGFRSARPQGVESVFLGLISTDFRQWSLLKSRGMSVETAPPGTPSRHSKIAPTRVHHGSTT